MEGCIAGTSTKKYYLRPSNFSPISNEAGVNMSHLNSTRSKNLGEFMKKIEFEVFTKPFFFLVKLRFVCLIYSRQF